MPVKYIDALSAKKMLDSSDAILVDIRDLESFEDSHDERAFHLTQKSLPVFIYNTKKDTTILVLCYHGNSSRLIAQFMVEQGFNNVYSINGGYEDWKNSILE